MSKLSEAEIFRYCIQAGFTPDQAVTMTAISLAESSGETGAHVTPDAGTQEDSVGLFQINRLAHDWSYNMDLTDPVQNAQAAFKVSGGGADISPWTVTHRSNGTPYSKNRARALQAAADNGYSNLTGYFDGVSGYGNSHGASTLPNGGPAATTSPFDLFAPAGGGAGAGRNAVLSGDLANAPSGTVERFVGLALAQAGDRYILGAEADASDPNPKAFDCSELVKWAAARSGVDVGDLADYQLLRMRDKGAEMSVEEALRTRGALLFRMPFNPSWATDGVGEQMSHVAISLGDGRTIEARGSAYGVMIVDAETNRTRFTHGARIPELRSASPQELAQIGAGPAVPGMAAGAGLAAAMLAPRPPTPPPPPPPPPTASDRLKAAMAGKTGDADHDGLADGLEDILGTSSSATDSDNDGLTDKFELFTSHTNPLASDSDGDGTADDLELALGRDAQTPDGPAGLGTRFELFLGGGPDVDQDGMGDNLEAIMGLATTAADSDGDGLSDTFEIARHLDPTKVDSDGDGVPDSLAGLFGTSNNPLQSVLPAPNAAKAAQDAADLLKGQGGGIEDLFRHA